MRELTLGPDDAPEACTLPTADRPLRLAEFTGLFRSTVTAVERTGPNHTRLVLNGPPALAEAVRDLAARESECCSFFQFGVRAQGEQVIFDIEVPPAYVDVLDGLTRLAVEAAGIDAIPAGERR